eukprot:SAG11_NODE_52128_length_107_cov_401.875000_1_plen_26_part_01
MKFSLNQMDQQLPYKTHSCLGEVLEQ